MLQYNTHRALADIYSLIRSLGKPAITKAQAKRLELRLKTNGDDEFCSLLKDRGVKSKPLREKLLKLLPTKLKQHSTS